MLAQTLRHAWHQPRAAASLQSWCPPGCTCTFSLVRRESAAGFSSKQPAFVPSFSWARRRRSVVEVAAGEATVASDVAHRLEAIAISTATEAATDSSCIDSKKPETKTHQPNATDSEASSIAPKGAGRRIRELPIGAFQKLPQVQVASEQLTSAVRKAQRLGATKTIRNEAAKARNRAARQMDAVMKAMSVPLTAYIKGFPPVTHLHPFERALLDLTVGEAHYTTTLHRVDSLRKRLIQLGKEFAARGARAASKKDAVSAADDGFAALEALFLKHSAALDDLVTVARQLRRLPLVDPFLPTVALVGAPNVGKSSLVALLSSGAPEVCDYPFTTRSIKMGHFFVEGRRHQVTDTPGLLRRPEDERNGMERLTLAALAYLPTAAIFVTDLTGDCGTSVADQWAIRQHLRERFPTKLWLDVLSKADLLKEDFDAADALVATGNARLRDYELDGAAVEESTATSAAPNKYAEADTAMVGTPPDGSSDVDSSATESLPLSQQQAEDSDTCSSAISSSEIGGSSSSAGSSAADNRVSSIVSHSGSSSGSSGGSSGRVYRWGDGSGTADVDGRQLAGANGAVNAAQVAAALPNAVRASATTADGMGELQGAVVQLLSEQAFAQQLATGRGPTEETQQDLSIGGNNTTRVLDRGMLMSTPT